MKFTILAILAVAAAAADLEQFDCPNCLGARKLD